MKDSKALTTVLTFLLLSGSMLGQQAEKTLVKSFNLLGNQTVVIDLDGPVEVKSWTNKTVRIEMNIALENRPVSFLKGMITAGRYNLKSSQIEQGLKINAPGMDRKVVLKGDELKETLSFVVFAPEDVIVKLNNEVSSQLDAAIDAGGSL